MITWKARQIDQQQSKLIQLIGKLIIVYTLILLIT